MVCEPDDATLVVSVQETVGNNVYPYFCNVFFFLMSYGTSAEIVSLHFVRMQSSLNPVQIDIIIKFYARCLLQ